MEWAFGNWHLALEGRGIRQLALGNWLGISKTKEQMPNAQCQTSLFPIYKAPKLGVIVKLSITALGGKSAACKIV